jgi:hypothetical protein
MTFFKTTFLSKYWIRSSQIAGFCPNNTKIFLGGGQTHIGLVDRYFSGQWNFEGASCSKKYILKSTPVTVKIDGHFETGFWFLLN